MCGRSYRIRISATKGLNSMVNQAIKPVVYGLNEEVNKKKQEVKAKVKGMISNEI